MAVFNYIFLSSSAIYLVNPAEEGLLVLKDMNTHTHLKPGQEGTRRLAEQYGDKLIYGRDIVMMKYNRLKVAIGW